MIRQVDKVKHFAVGYVIGLGGRSYDMDVALAVGAAVAWGKERYDKKHNGTSEGWDAYATLLGVVCGSATVRLWKMFA